MPATTMPAASSPLPQHLPSARVLDDLALMRLGVLDPVFGGAGSTVTLDVPASVWDAAGRTGALELTDPEGALVATVSVASSYDLPQPHGPRVGVTGQVALSSDAPSRAFQRLLRPPAAVRAAHPPETVSVPVDRPLTETDLQAVVARAGDGPVLLLVLAGDGVPGGLSAPALIRSALAAAALLPDAEVVLVPLAQREEPAHSRLLERVLCAYAPGPVLTVEGAGELPAQVAREVDGESRAGADRGVVVFFTGLSGSGKSTLARALRDHLLEAGGRSVSLLDGDVVRRHLSSGLTFSRADRDTNVLRIGWVAAEIGRHGGLAIASPIAPFDDTRREARAMAARTRADFVLVHVATPLAECESRDRKGLYARARRGDIPEFTGISSPYEEPADAEVVVDTTDLGVEEALEPILTHLRECGLLTRKRGEHP